MTFLNHPLFFAQAPSPPAFGILNMLVPMTLMFVIMYVILIKPQQKKQKQHEEMLKKLKSGDRIVTSGGIHGIISGVKEQTVMIKIADNVKVELNRANVSEVLPIDSATVETKK